MYDYSRGPLKCLRWVAGSGLAIIAALNNNIESFSQGVQCSNTKQISAQTLKNDLIF